MAGLFSVIIPAELHKQFYPRGSYILQAHGFFCRFYDSPCVPNFCGQSRFGREVIRTEFIKAAEDSSAFYIRKTKCMFFLDEIGNILAKSTVKGWIHLSSSLPSGMDSNVRGHSFKPDNSTLIYGFVESGLLCPRTSLMVSMETSDASIRLASVLLMVWKPFRSSACHAMPAFAALCLIIEWADHVFRGHMEACCGGK